MIADLINSILKGNKTWLELWIWRWLSRTFSGLNIVSTQAGNQSSQNSQRQSSFRTGLMCKYECVPSRVSGYRLQAWSSSRDTESSPLSNLVLWYRQRSLCSSTACFRRVCRRRGGSITEGGRYAAHKHTNSKTYQRLDLDSTHINYGWVIDRHFILRYNSEKEILLLFQYIV